MIAENDVITLQASGYLELSGGGGVLVLDPLNRERTALLERKRRSVKRLVP